MYRFKFDQNHTKTIESSHNSLSLAEFGYHSAQGQQAPVYEASFFQPAIIRKSTTLVFTKLISTCDRK